MEHRRVNYNNLYIKLLVIGLDDEWTYRNISKLCSVLLCPSCGERDVCKLADYSVLMPPGLWKYYIFCKNNDEECLWKYVMNIWAKNEKNKLREE